MSREGRAARASSSSCTKEKLAKEHSKRRKKGTYVDAKILHQVAAGGLSGRQDDEAAAGGDSHG
jgi:hypothetical protein